MDDKITYALDAAQWALVQHLIQMQIREFSALAATAQCNDNEALYHSAADVASTYIAIDDEIARQREERRQI